MKHHHLAPKFISAVFCATFSAVQISCPVRARANLSDLENKKSSIVKQQNALNNKLKNIKNNINDKENYKIKLENNIKSIKTRIADESDRLNEINHQIEEKEASISELQSGIDNRYDQLKSRMLAIYKAGDTSLIEIFLESKDFTDLLDKADLVQKISNHDTAIIDSLNSDIEKVASEKANIENIKVEIESIKISLTANKRRLEQAERENERTISALKGAQSETQSKLGQIAREKQILEDQIRKFHEEYVRNQGGNVQYRKGRYVWPAPKCRIITSRFGPRWGRFHWGIDISGANAHGSPIVAAGDGVVIKANFRDRWGSGWGYHVMIDHGNGYATLYAHCSWVGVSVGQHVKAGQLIAKVGNTGHSFGAHLHFETWHNGRRYNPSTEV